MTGTPVWVTELAERFWADAGGPPPNSPRDLELAAAFALPLTVVELPGLRVDAVRAYLDARRIPAGCVVADRPLRAAVYCWAGVGIVFLDPTDPPDERRFSFAHELAHFLRDYAAPRRRVEQLLGRAALEVLDGPREPTVDERIRSVLRHHSLARRRHLMSRDPSGRPSGQGERRSEADADRLACELLAPADRFRDAADAGEVERRLVAEYGLPAPVAVGYARLLMPLPDSPGGLIARLKKSS